MRALSRPPPGHVSLRTRARNLVAAVKNGTLLTLRFIVGFPARSARDAHAWERLVSIAPASPELGNSPPELRRRFLRAWAHRTPQIPTPTPASPPLPR